MTDLQRQLTAALIIRSIAHNAKLSMNIQHEAWQFWDYHITQKQSGDAAKDAIKALESADMFCWRNEIEFLDAPTLNRFRSISMEIMEPI